jgi:hypothetical protein
MKKIVRVWMLLFAPFLIGQTLPNYTTADVAKHATAADCWMILNTNKVYNFTTFIPAHPGGNGMATSCGTDGTTRFNGIGHSSGAVGQEVPFLIGNLVVGTSPIVVSITPISGTVVVGTTLQFTATAANSTQGVTWAAAPAALGTVSASGLFSALAAGTGTVIATSVEDNTKSAIATIVDTSLPPPGISVDVVPMASALTVGDKRQFTAKVTNSTLGVTWSSSGLGGAVDTNGLFTASAVGAAQVVAASIEDSTKTATATVTVTAGPPPPPPDQACSITQAGTGRDLRFTIKCFPTKPEIPSERYSCAARATATGITVTCQPRRGGGNDD